MTTRSSPATYTILDAMADPALFGAWFQPEENWRAWITFAKSLFALPMSEAEAGIYRQHTDRSTLPTSPAREAWLVVGRRGGKSWVAALTAVYLACFRDYRTVLTRPGERGVVMVIAADRTQARVIFGYIAGLIDATPMLARMVTRRTAEAIHLANRITIEVHTASFKTVRGYTVIAAILDEVAFWETGETSLNPDVEIVTAIRPAMASLAAAREGLLLGISSPYARRGVLWDAYHRHYGQDGDSVLVWQASTKAMNPTIPQSFLDAEYAKDPAAARAEYGAEFRTDIEGFLTREVVDACVICGRTELPPISGVRYIGFTDLSGAVTDSMALAIAHREGDRVVLDLVRERPSPCSPEDVVQEFAALVTRYHVPVVRGDRYAGEWPRERFRARGIDYEPADRVRSDLYRDLLPLLLSRGADLLDSPRLVAQLVGLERRVGRSGKDQITRSPNGHDDVANAAAGALVHAAQCGDQLMFADWGDRARREQAGELPAWICPRCGGDKGAAGRCCRCDRPLWTWAEISPGL